MVMLGLPDGVASSVVPSPLKSHWYSSTRVPESLVLHVRRTLSGALPEVGLAVRDLTDGRRASQVKGVLRQLEVVGDVDPSIHHPAGIANGQDASGAVVHHRQHRRRSPRVDWRPAHIPTSRSRNSRCSRVPPAAGIRAGDDAGGGFGLQARPPEHGELLDPFSQKARA